ncbi:hypothetical protein RJ640_015270 [Escallonia rubra]|uniref:Cell division control protein n=1 Tax=Escallonia rubra TaxID=112253 RepID=A0AA88U1Q6_9ASTE|nr:hypothetical protein RJ640_015270 [Escallonia rubra]
MPTIAGPGSSPFAGRGKTVRAENAVEIQSDAPSTPRKRILRSNAAQQAGQISPNPSPNSCSPMKLKSPRRRLTDSPNRFRERFWFNLCIDMEQLSMVKEAMHVSTAPSTVVCREYEQKRILEFCKQCVKQEKAGSLYVCGCPGTGKSLSMEKVKENLTHWTKEERFPPLDVLTINCTSLTSTSEIFSKILGHNQARKKTSSPTSPLKHLQRSYSQKLQSPDVKMMLVIVDELDYLITRDQAVLHDLFMLTTYPFSRCILIGIANAIDLADRFLPKLQSLNCKPMVVTFRAYSKDQIIMIIQQRLGVLPYRVFQPQTLELCARKVAAASGDMRKALCVCRSAIEMLEAELRESTYGLDLPSVEGGFSDKRTGASCKNWIKQANNIVRVDHMALALSKAYRSPTVEIIQSLPQHQQIILCSIVKLFRGPKKDTTVGELNKFYTDICKSTLIPPAGIMELSSMCRVLADQGLLKLGQSREDKLRRVTLKVDEADISFALQGVRFFRNCLQ